MKIRERFSHYFFLALIFVFSSCAYDKREQPVPKIDTSLKNCDTGFVVTYNSFVKNVLETNCTFSLCHGTDAPPGFDYTIYSNIKAKVDSGFFQDRVLNKREMPPSNTPGSRTLDTCTLYKLQKWVNSGALE